ncbi:hypothetical protein [Rhizobium sp.]|jgi:Ser-tRNA(Ala) deacylase AlaX|uniref:hypothetical protein n=1 Tax=Rhizobium sp. TaxID=391 RepID=UPI000E84CB79|nr:hypothetical protein [Rhizobium sp.]
MEQKNIYYSDPGITQNESVVLRTTTNSTATLVALKHNIVRPAGGGEPCDQGLFCFGDTHTSIVSAVKQQGLTWLMLSKETPIPNEGDQVSVQLDVNHREQRRRLHTGVHIAIRSCLNVLGGEIKVTEANISEDASQATFALDTSTPIDRNHIDMIVSMINQVFIDAIPVEATKAKSVDDARKQYGPLFRLSERHELSGKIRLIKIGDFDINPCAGLHWKDTAIGPCNLNIAPSSNGLSGLLRIMRYTEKET